VAEPGLFGASSANPLNAKAVSNEIGLTVFFMKISFNKQPIADQKQCQTPERFQGFPAPLG
jgi:hypothetical protein